MEIIKDQKGVEIKVGDKVKWIDPTLFDTEEEEEANSRIWEVYKIDQELGWAYICDGASEAEVIPEELLVCDKL